MAPLPLVACGKGGPINPPQPHCIRCSSWPPGLFTSAELAPIESKFGHPCFSRCTFTDEKRRRLQLGQIVAFWTTPQGRRGRQTCGAPGTWSPKLHVFCSGVRRSASCKWAASLRPTAATPVEARLLCMSFTFTGGKWLINHVALYHLVTVDSGPILLNIFIHGSFLPDVPWLSTCLNSTSVCLCVHFLFFHTEGLNG